MDDSLDYEDQEAFREDSELQQKPHALPAEKVTRRELFVHGLSRSISHTILWDLFAFHGVVHECRIKKHGYWALITMASIDDAIQATKGLNGKYLADWSCSLQIREAQDPRPQTQRFRSSRSYPWPRQTPVQKRDRFGRPSREPRFERQRDKNY